MWSSPGWMQGQVDNVIFAGITCIHIHHLHTLQVTYCKHNNFGEKLKKILLDIYFLYTRSGN